MKNPYDRIDKRTLAYRLQFAFGFSKEKSEKLAHTLVIGNINKNNGMVVRANQALMDIHDIR